MDLSEFVAHYGIKGMRWGVRKKSSSSTSERTRYSKSPKKLSDEELAKRIKRMETEKRYNQLNRPDTNKGKEIAAEILQSVGSRVAKTVLTGGSLLAIKLALESQFGSGVGSEVTKRLK